MKSNFILYLGKKQPQNPLKTQSLTSRLIKGRKIFAALNSPEIVLLSRLKVCCLFCEG